MPERPGRSSGCHCFRKFGEYSRTNEVRIGILGLETRHLEPGHFLAGGLARAVARLRRTETEAGAIERLPDGRAAPRFLDAERHGALAHRAAALRIGREELEVRALAVEVETRPAVVAGLRRPPLEGRELRPQILRGVCGAESFGVQNAIDVVQIDGGHGGLRNSGEAGETGDTKDHRRENGGTRSRARHGRSGPGGDAPAPRARGRSRRSRRGPRSRSRGPRASDACRRRAR